MLATVSLFCLGLAGSKVTGAGKGTVTRNRKKLRAELPLGSGYKKRWRAVVADSGWRAAATRGGDTHRHVAATHSDTWRRHIDTCR